MISKMSVKGIGCKPKGEEEPTRLCIILGKATGIKTGEDNTGRVWKALSGTFRGTNLATNEVFRSGKLFLPSGIHEAVESAVMQLPEQGGVVKFAMELRSVSAKNPIGYSYQAVNLMPIESETDELSDLITLAANVPQLAAPATAAPEVAKAAVAQGTTANAKKK